MNWKSIEDRLVDDYKQCLRWFSTQMMVAAGGIQTGWALLPPSFQQRVPGWIITAITVSILLAGIIGRVIKQEDSKNP